MQKTANLGVGTGLVIGAIGASATGASIAAIALGIFYANQSKHVGFKKGTLSFLAVVMSMFTVTIGGMVGSGLTGKEWLADSSSTTTTTPTPPSAPAAAPAAPATPVPVAKASSNPNPILAKVEEQNNAPFEEFNRPRNGGTTTLVQKCEALKQFNNDGAYGKVAEISFQIGFEHELGSLGVDQACAKVGVPQ